MSDESPYFEVSYSGDVKDRLVELILRAAAAGRDAEVRASFLRIHAWLRADPESMGEPFQDRVGLELTEYCGFDGPLIVRYAVHRPTKQAFVVVPFRVARWAGF